MSKISDEYMTPIKYIKSVREVFGGQIDLDPASSIEANIRVQAKQIYTKEDSAFKHHLYGKVFLNPPYSKPNLTSFSSLVIRYYLIETIEKIGEIIILTPTSPWESWFRNLTKFKNPVCNTDHRIKFISPSWAKLTTNSPKGGGSFIYLGNNEDKFIEVFREHGTIWRRV